MGMWKMVLAVAGVAFLLLNGSDSARAAGPGAATSPSRATGELKDPSPKSPPKAIVGPPRKAKASPSIERASRPEPDSPVLNLLWLLTGASRRY
jgi:hypothetical protein